MHRLLVETDDLLSDCPFLPKDAAKHLMVLRPKNGENIELFDGKGKFRTFCYHDDWALTTDPNRVPPTSGRGLSPAEWGLLAPLEGVCEMPRPATELTLFACVTKGSRWDWTIEKATELGVTRIVPVISERTIVRLAVSECEAKRARWQRIAEDAARQSDAKWLPEIHAPVTFDESLPLVRETTCFVGALTDPPPKTIGKVLAEEKEKEGKERARLDNGEQTHLENEKRVHFATFIGPEGDFTPSELAALLEIATPVSFGATILRAETAAIYAISVLKAFRD